MALAPAASAGSLFWLTVRPGHSSDPLLVTHPLPDPTNFAMCFFHRKKKIYIYSMHRHTGWATKGEQRQQIENCSVKASPQEDAHHCQEHLQGLSHNQAEHLPWVTNACEHKVPRRRRS